MATLGGCAGGADVATDDAITGNLGAQEGSLNGSVQFRGNPVVAAENATVTAMQLYDALPPGPDDIPTAAIYTQRAVTQTNKWGQFYFTQLPTGTYIVDATLDGSKAESDSVDISTEHSTIVWLTK